VQPVLAHSSSRIGYAWVAVPHSQASARWTHCPG